MSYEINSFEDKELLGKLSDMFLKFGLSSNESRLYMYLAKNGKKTAQQIFKSSKIPRTETYRILAKLQGRGIVTSSFNHPMMYTALPINKVIETLINQEKNRIKELESIKDEMIRSFHKIPAIGDNTDKNKNQFQILQGTNQINNKINELIGKAREKILLIGSEKDVLQFNHGGVFDQFKIQKINAKILLPKSKKTQKIVLGIKKDCFKMVSDADIRNLCFVIIDENEIVFLLKNELLAKADQIAIWSDSKAIVSPLDLLFTIIWHNYKTAKEVGKYSSLEKRQQEYKFKLKELEQENIALATLNRILSDTRM